MSKHSGAVYSLKLIPGPILLLSGYLAVGIPYSFEGDRFLLFSLFLLPAYVPFPFGSLIMGLIELFMLQAALLLLPALNRKPWLATLLCFGMYSALNTWITSRIIISSGGF